MNAPFLLALPYLHAELNTLPPGCLTIWPGLPGQPAGTWAPVYPWSSEVSAACLADFEQTCRNGASGSPVLALGADTAHAGLTEAEQQALLDFMGKKPLPRQTLRENAQQVLLLTWLQETQILDMNRLEKNIAALHTSLHRQISGLNTSSPESSHLSDNSLPDWKIPLAAILTFLPDMPESVAFYIGSSSMADTLQETDSFEPTNCNHELKNCYSLTMTADTLISLCGHISWNRLKQFLPLSVFKRRITLFIPQQYRKI